MKKRFILFFSFLIVQLILSPSHLQASKNPNRWSSYINPFALYRRSRGTKEYSPENLKLYRETINNINKMESVITEKNNAIKWLEKICLKNKKTMTVDDKYITSVDRRNAQLESKFAKWLTWPSFVSNHYGKIIIVVCVTGGALVIYDKYYRKKDDNKKNAPKKRIYVLFSKPLENIYNNMNLSCENIHKTLVVNLKAQKNNLISDHAKIQKQIGKRKEIATSTILEVTSSYKNFKSDLQEINIIGYEDETNISALIDAQICFLYGDETKKKGLISKYVNKLPGKNKKAKKISIDILKLLNSVAIKPFKKSKKQPERTLETEFLFITHKEIDGLIKGITKYNNAIESPFATLIGKIDTIVEENSQKIVTYDPMIWKGGVTQYHANFSTAVTACCLPKKVFKQISGFDTPFKKNTDFKTIKYESDFYKKETKQKSKTTQFLENGLETGGTMVLGGLKELGRKQLARFTKNNDREEKNDGGVRVRDVTEKPKKRTKKRVVKKK